MTLPPDLLVPLLGIVLIVLGWWPE